MPRDEARKLIEALRQGVDINQIASVVVEALDQGYRDYDTPWETGFEFGDIDFYQIADAMDERQKAAAFKALRHAKGLSLEEVALNASSKAIKVSPQAISNLEEGKRRQVRDTWLFELLAWADHKERCTLTGARPTLLWEKPPRSDQDL